MRKLYLGVDIGSISTKGVLIDEYNNVVTSSYINTEADPIMATKILISNLKNNISSDYEIKGIGVTGSARKLIGLMLHANVIKNEITAHSIGSLSRYPDIKTIIEIGGQDSKVILLENGIVKDYAMNTLCAAGTGAFLSSQARRIGVDVSKFASLGLQSTNPIKIAARCTVFAESDLVHKAQVGYKKEDIIAGLCKSVVLNYLNNVCKGKRLLEPIVFQGGVSKNSCVVKYFKDILKTDVIVSDEGPLMGAIGIAILSKNGIDKTYDLNIEDISFVTKGRECIGCSNNCEILNIYSNGEFVDSWGSKCGNVKK